MEKIQVIKTTENALPKYETPESAGCDLRAELNLLNDKFLFNSMIGWKDGIKFIDIMPGGRVLIPTGLQIALKPGQVGLVCSRSGLALKNGVFVLNACGVVDSDYRNDVGVILANFGTEIFTVKQGDRIAQLMIVNHEQVEFDEVTELNATDRSAGFGSTGIN